MSLIPLGFWAASGGAVSAGSFDLLETEILASSQASVTFSSLGDYAADYQHLQIRATLRSSASPAFADSGQVRVNADSTASYSFHTLEGNGSNLFSMAYSSQTSMFLMLGGVPAGGSPTGTFGGLVIDILDPFVATKNTTFRALQGFGGGPIRLNSGAYLKTDALTEIQLFASTVGNNIVTGSRFSLYGLKGA